jgi:septal ring-binding cell division protein DamX
MPKRRLSAMKNTMMVIISIFVLLLVAIGISGFIVFNNRLAESKQDKESGEISTERTIQADVLESNINMSAAENGLMVQIISPSDQSAVTSSYITLRGKTVAQAEVFVNDIETVADANGDFSVGLTLDEGDNPIMVVANDQAGNVGETEITVNYETTE